MHRAVHCTRTLLIRPGAMLLHPTRPLCSLRAQPHTLSIPTHAAMHTRRALCRPVCTSATTVETPTAAASATQGGGRTIAAFIPRTKVKDIQVCCCVVLFVLLVLLCVLYVLPGGMHARMHRLHYVPSCTHRCMYMQSHALPT